MQTNTGRGTAPRELTTEELALVGGGRTTLLLPAVQRAREVAPYG